MHKVRLASLVAAAGLFLAAALAAQETEAEKVRFETCDGVTLRGTYYPAQGRNAPYLLLLHDLGRHSRATGLQHLAKTLHKEGYAVLAFDFRGHGSSTGVDRDTFWAQPVNRKLVKGCPDDEIRDDAFDARYHGVLVNDIAAAKAFLDRRNDAGECNSSSLVVIGIGSGATLGAIWVNAEWHRYRLVASPGLAAQVARSPEGRYILSAIWLGISPTLGKRRVNWASALDLAARQGKVPMLVFFNGEDETSRGPAKSWEKQVLGQEKLPYTASVEVLNAGKSSPTDLLHSRFGTANAIAEYLRMVAPERGEEWMQHDARNALFVWRIGNQTAQANRPGEKTLQFQTYEPFIPPR